ncbi:MAG: indole-3-glycerol-phosphate synthase [Candidatus Obscuribacterales bacterium]|nr:indole-3-glycerol-phosphate synthase [Steroidobacteraceae bacterium]
MSGLLTEMAQSSLERLEVARVRESESELWARANDTPPAPPLKFSDEGFDIIAECKLHSPSMGNLSAHTADVEGRVAAYAQGGAAVVSVLTEPKRFGGSLGHLARASEILAPFNVPTMRKDFLVYPYQVMEGRVAGAGGVLVIARMLERHHICELLDCAAMLKMFVLVEAFDAADLVAIKEILVARKKGHSEQILVGVNCRDLETLAVDIERFGPLANALPRECASVAESGVASVADVVRVVGWGYRVALIGTTLMNTSAPKKLVSDLLAAGREKAMSMNTRKLHITKMPNS